MGKGERFIGLIMLTHINLPSDSSREFYSNNHASNFRVKIPENFPILNSSKKYACAVTEVIFPSNFKNIPETQKIRMDLSFVNKLYHLRKDTGHSDGRDLHYIGSGRLDVEIPAGTWSVEKIIDKINSSIDKKIYKINFRYNDKSKRVVISAMSGSYISRMTIGKYLAPILGFRAVYGAKKRKKIGEKKAFLPMMKSLFKKSHFFFEKSQQNSTQGPFTFLLKKNVGFLFMTVDVASSYPFWEFTNTFPSATARFPCNSRRYLVVACQIPLTRSANSSGGGVRTPLRAFQIHLNSEIQPQSSKCYTDQ